MKVLSWTTTPYVVVIVSFGLLPTKTTTTTNAAANNIGGSTTTSSNGGGSSNFLRHRDLNSDDENGSPNLLEQCGVRYSFTTDPPKEIDGGCGCVVTPIDDESYYQNIDDIVFEEKETKILESSDSDSDDDDDDEKIINCNNCGACSNCHDVRLLATSAADTTGDIFSQLFDFQCAFLYYTTKLLRSDLPPEEAEAEATRQARQCLAASTASLDGREDDPRGFTDDCLECWVEAVRCTPNECVNYDIETGEPQDCAKLLGLLLTTVSNGGDLSAITMTDLEEADLFDCLVCDAVKCTPAYVECAGAERLRIGRESPALIELNKELGRKSCIQAYEHDVCKLKEIIV